MEGTCQLKSGCEVRGRGPAPAQGHLRSPHADTQDGGLRGGVDARAPTVGRAGVGVRRTPTVWWWREAPGKASLEVLGGAPGSAACPHAAHSLPLTQGAHTVRRSSRTSLPLRTSSKMTGRYGCSSPSLVLPPTALAPIPTPSSFPFRPLPRWDLLRPGDSWEPGHSLFIRQDRAGCM